MIWSDFLGKHIGETAYIVGLGDSWSAYKDGPLGVVFGVNDCGRHFDPDYLVVVDKLQKFTLERWMHIEHTKAKNVFTQLPLKIKEPDRVVPIMLSSHRGSSLNGDKVIDISYSSTFVAMNLAYHMGFMNIALCGSDYKDHNLGSKMDDILDHTQAFAERASMVGVSVVSIVEDSPMNKAVQYVPANEIKNIF